MKLQKNALGKTLMTHNEYLKACEDMRKQMKKLQEEKQEMYKQKHEIHVKYLKLQKQTSNKRQGEPPSLPTGNHHRTNEIKQMIPVPLLLRIEHRVPMNTLTLRLVTTVKPKLTTVNTVATRVSETEDTGTGRDVIPKCARKRSRKCSRKSKTENSNMRPESANMITLIIFQSHVSTAWMRTNTTSLNDELTIDWSSGV